MPIPPAPPTVQVKNAGTLVGTRRGINFLAGAGLTRTITDDAANNEVEVTLAQAVPTEGSVRVYHNADQSIATATNVSLAFNTERFDTDGYHDTVTNNMRLTVPAGLAGKYLMYATVNWASATDATSRILQLRVNGGTYIAIDSRPAIATAAQPTRQTISTIYDLAVGDYVEIVAHQLAVGAVIINALGNFSPEFGMSRIGGVLASGGSAAAAHVTRVANQAITTGTDTPLSFDTETRDDGNFWVAGSPTRLTAPATGWYNVAGWVIWEVNTTGIRYLHLRKNTTDYVATVSDGPYASDGNVRQGSAMTLYLAAGDFIELVVMHNRGANLNATGALSVAKIGLG